MDLKTSGAAPISRSKPKTPLHALGRKIREKMKKSTPEPKQIEYPKQEQSVKVNGVEYPVVYHWYCDNCLGEIKDPTHWHCYDCMLFIYWFVLYIVLYIVLCIVLYIVLCIVLYIVLCIVLCERERKRRRREKEKKRTNRFLLGPDYDLCPLCYQDVGKKHTHDMWQETEWLKTRKSVKGRDCIESFQYTFSLCMCLCVLCLCVRQRKKEHTHT